MGRVRALGDISGRHFTFSVRRRKSGQPRKVEINLPGELQDSLVNFAPAYNSCQ
jgi:hypothetical protein